MWMERRQEIAGPASGTGNFCSHPTDILWHDDQHVSSGSREHLRRPITKIARPAGT